MKFLATLLLVCLVKSCYGQLDDCESCKATLHTLFEAATSDDVIELQLELFDVAICQFQEEPEACSAAFKKHWAKSAEALLGEEHVEETVEGFCHNLHVCNPKKKSAPKDFDDCSHCKDELILISAVYEQDSTIEHVLSEVHLNYCHTLEGDEHADCETFANDYIEEATKTLGTFLFLHTGVVCEGVFGVECFEPETTTQEEETTTFIEE